MPPDPARTDPSAPTSAPRLANQPIHPTMLLATPRITPAHAVTFEALYWPARYSAGTPWDQARVHTAGGTLSLADITLYGGQLLSQARIVDSIPWDQVSAAAIVHLPNAWETILVAGVMAGQPVAVSVPVAGLKDQPPNLVGFLRDELQILVDSARMIAVGDALDQLLAS